jgi:CheY-like chemotaxis protein
VDLFNVLFVGDATCDESRATLDLLTEQASVEIAVSCAAAERVLARRGTEYDLILLATARPGEITARQAHRLRRQAPLSPVVALLGSWCDGQMRTGRPLPAVVQTAWHAGPMRLAREMASWQQGELPIWEVPPTATPEERLQHEVDRTPGFVASGLIALCGRDVSLLECLADSCAELGFSTSRVLPKRPHVAHRAAAILLDLPGDVQKAGELAQLKTEFPQTPIVVLVHFPRPEDRRRLLAAGAAAVMAKPVLLPDLSSQLERLLADVEEPLSRLIG